MKNEESRTTQSGRPLLWEAATKTKHFNISPELDARIQAEVERRNATTAPHRKWTFSSVVADTLWQHYMEPRDSD